jgi:collagen type III alpha
MERLLDTVLGTIKSVSDRLSARIEALEKRAPVPGRDGSPGPMGPEGLPGTRGLDGKDGRDGADGRDGKDAVVTREDVLHAILADPSLLDAAVERYLQAHPPAPGKDGRDGIDGKDGIQGPSGLDGMHGKDGAQGRDGRDGQPGSQGFHGEKGLDGTHGRDGIDGKDGAPGRDGRDGTLENVKLVQVNERAWRLCFKDGTPIEGGEMRFGHVLDRGVYKAGETYEQGDAVTWGGSLWIAQFETSAQPGGGASERTGWRLAVKKGTDGRQGPQGPEGPQGKQGPQGERGLKGY